MQKEKESSKPRKYTIIYRILFCVILLIAIGEGVWIYLSSNLANRIITAPYSFIDLRDDNPLEDDLVTAEGSWVSSVDSLAFPIDSVSIECWKQFGHCWVAHATLMDEQKFDPFLSLGMDLYEIQYWNDDFIETKPSKPLAGCVEEVYRLDRRSKTATYTRRTINTSAFCEGVSKEPIVAKLGELEDRIKSNK